MCTVFAIYDMCKDLVENYPGLRRKTEKTIEVIDVSHGRGTGVAETGEQYWHISGAEAKGVVAAISVLGKESLNSLQTYAAAHEGII